jgi:predicted acetylornithine/succinylornithine family transaminase
MDAQTIIDLESRYLVQTYRRAPFVLERGEGCYLFDSQGRRYLDCMAGIAVNALGYGDPEVVAAINDQARKLIHISNLFHTTPHVELARRLVEHSFADRVFFSNSGTEAIEGAMKFARKWARTNYGNHKTDFVAFSGAFHGRTMGALAATAREHYQAPFRPLVPGVSFATFNDLASAEAAITDQTCAVLVEPVQGEGGIHPAAPEFLAGLRELCDRYHAVLIFDEIQSGLGRTGTLWAHEFYGVTPDVLCLAKPLAGGLPIGAILVTEAVAGVVQPGDHGSTFAANPLVCRVAQIVFDRVNRPAFLAEVRAKGAYLMDRLATLSPPHVVEIRGRGLMVGVELDVPANRVIQAGFEHGLIMVNAGERVLRLVPPLIIERAQLDELAGKLARTLEEL